MNRLSIKSNRTNLALLAQTVAGTDEAHVALSILAAGCRGGGRDWDVGGGGGRGCWDSEGGRGCWDSGGGTAKLKN